MRKFTLGLALASSLLAAGGASAQPAPRAPAAAERDMPPPPPRHRGDARGMMRADANHDGVITRAEARAEAERMFAARDRNGDGRLTAEEMRLRHHARRGQEPRAGKAGREISLAQFERKAMRRFDRIDANRDGRIAQAEVREHKQAKRQQRQDRAQQQG